MHYNIGQRLHYPNLHMPDGTSDLLTFGRLSSSQSLSLNTNVLLRNSLSGDRLSGDRLTSHWLLCVSSFLVTHTGTSSGDGRTGDRCGWSLVVVTSGGDTGSSLGLSVEGSELALSFSLVCVVLHIISDDQYNERHVTHVSLSLVGDGLGLLGRLVQSLVLVDGCLVLLGRVLLLGLSGGEFCMSAYALVV